VSIEQVGITRMTIGDRHFIEFFCTIFKSGPIDVYNQRLRLFQFFCNNTQGAPKPITSETTDAFFARGYPLSFFYFTRATTETGKHKRAAELIKIHSSAVVLNDDFARHFVGLWLDTYFDPRCSRVVGILHQLENCQLVTTEEFSAYKSLKMSRRFKS
jgi:hypothetical protein